jgi:hypothetical protein
MIAPDACVGKRASVPIPKFATALAATMCANFGFGALACVRGILIENNHVEQRPGTTAQVRHVNGGHHEFVNGFIMLPNCRQARAKLKCDPEDCCLRARSAAERRNSQPPSPPEFGWAGPVWHARSSDTRRSTRKGSTPMTSGRRKPARFLSTCCRRGRLSGSQRARRQASLSVFPPCRSAPGRRLRRCRRP